MLTRSFFHLLVVTATTVCVLVTTVEVDITVSIVLVNRLVVALGVTLVDCCEISDDHGGCDVVTMLFLWAARQSSRPTNVTVKRK